MMVEQPSILVRLVHSVPHINITLHRVNNTFDPKSVIYIEVSVISLSLRFFPFFACVFFILSFYSFVQFLLLWFALCAIASDFVLRGNNGHDRGHVRRRRRRQKEKN